MTNSKNPGKRQAFCGYFAFVSRNSVFAISVACAVPGPPAGNEKTHRGAVGFLKSLWFAG
jgi:hypothetical protein